MNRPTWPTADVRERLAVASAALESARVNASAIASMASDVVHQLRVGADLEGARPAPGRLPVVRIVLATSHEVAIEVDDQGIEVLARALDALRAARSARATSCAVQVPGVATGHGGVSFVVLRWDADAATTEPAK